MFFHNRGYLSKLFLKLTPGSFACKSRMATFFFASLSSTDKKEWETLGDGTVAQIPFQEEVLLTLGKITSYLQLAI